MKYGTHVLDTPEHERSAIADALVTWGIPEPTKEQIEAAVKHVHSGGNETYMAALRAGGRK